MGMARLLDANAECSQAAWLSRAKVRVLELSFRCNITNYYFYFRFIAFVNCIIPMTSIRKFPPRASAQAGHSGQYRLDAGDLTKIHERGI